MGNLNPLRYRGYYYDAELELYWLNTRFYDPNLGRFVNADGYASTGQGIIGNNMYAYCGNNPVVRIDNGGELWFLAAVAKVVVKAVVKVTVAVAKKYVSDVVKNIADGKSGLDILKPSSSLGEYVAEGVSALIPGSGLTANVTKNIVSEGIEVTEKIINGEDVDIGKSVFTIAKDTFRDGVFQKATNALTKKVNSLRPRNYSSFAGKLRKQNPNVSRQEIEEKLGNRNVVVKYANSAIEAAMDIAKLCISD